MGVTKQYLRTVQTAVFGLVGSANGSTQFVKWRNIPNRYILTTSCENIFLWDTKTDEKILTLYGDKHEATSLQKSPDDRHVAVGYSNGTVRIFNLVTTECEVTFSGHKSAVMCLCYDTEGMRLASGSKDTEIVLWDVVSESGLFRLRGHKGVVTRIRFTKNYNYLISSSKDTFVKFWDLETQHCFKTLTGHHTEVWDFVLIRDDRRLLTGSGDSEIRAWDLTYTNTEDESISSEKKIKLDDAGEEDDIIKCHKVGSVLRRGKDRVVCMTTDPSGRILVCHGNDANVETFLMCNEKEVERRLHRRNKKERKKAQKNAVEDEDVKSTDVTSISFSDQIKRLTMIKTGGKPKFVDVLMESDSVQVLTLLHNNLVELWSFDASVEKAEAKKLAMLTQPGHRTDVRTVSFSSDNIAMLSASAESIKIWNRASRQCIRTMSCDYALCSSFLPGDRHCVIGTKNGKLQLFDIASGQLLEEFDAHDGAVWSLSLSTDQQGFVTGGADKRVKFWQLDLISDEAYSTTSKRLSFIHTRTLELQEEVLNVKLSSNNKLIAVSLLDNTVKVFFVDSLKFFLSLYGHKFPVLAIDISSDNTLIVTGSADKNVKIWGLDFGDCHKSIFAHDDSVTCVQFVPRTHMFFTGGKDNLIKQWDADNFQKIMTLDGHHGQLWSLAVSPDGQHIFSASHDKSLRLWQKTEEPLILEEEQQMEREAEDEKAMAAGESVIPGETNPETGLAAKKTVESVKAAEKLMEGIDIYKEECQKLIDHRQMCEAKGKKLPPPDVHVLMIAYDVSTPEKFMLQVLKRIKSSELEEALLVLPFGYVLDLIKILNMFLEKSWEVELSLRCLLFLFRVHHGRLTLNSNMLSVIDKLKEVAQRRVLEMRDTIGFNLAGLQFMRRQVEEKEDVALFADATENFKKKKRKKRFKTILTVQ